MNLDFSHEGMENPELPEVEEDTGPDAEWRARRKWAFGASDIAALMIAVGMRHAEDFPKWVQRNAKPIRWKGRAVPRLFLEKAGLRRGLKATPVMELGTEREPELICQYTEKVRRGRGGPESRVLDPDSIRHSSSVPRWMLPLTHHRLKHLAVTPDGWAYDVMGGLVMLEAKCSYRGYHETYRGAGPHHVLQLTAQMMTTDAVSGIAVEGERWSNAFHDHCGEPTGLVIGWPVWRDERLIVEVEHAVSLGWEAVEEVQHAAMREAA